MKLPIRMPTPPTVTGRTTHNLAAELVQQIRKSSVTTTLDLSGITFVVTGAELEGDLVMVEVAQTAFRVREFEAAYRAGEGFGITIKAAG